jgi:hypothetical protein
MTDLRSFRVRYNTGTDHGAFTLRAENADHALALAQARVRRERGSKARALRTVYQVDPSEEGEP